MEVSRKSPQNQTIKINRKFYSKLIEKSTHFEFLYLEPFEISNQNKIELFASSSKCKFGNINQRIRSNLIVKIV
jgi:hypothetical protein